LPRSPEIHDATTPTSWHLQKPLQLAYSVLTTQRMRWSWACTVLSLAKSCPRDIPTRNVASWADLTCDQTLLQLQRESCERSLDYSPLWRPLYLEEQASRDVSNLGFFHAFAYWHRDDVALGLSHWEVQCAHIDYCISLTLGAIWISETRGASEPKHDHEATNTGLW